MNLRYLKVKGSLVGVAEGLCLRLSPVRGIAQADVERRPIKIVVEGKENLVDCAEELCLGPLKLRNTVQEYVET